MQNLESLEYRKLIIDEILGDENQARKAENFRRSEIYRKRHAPFMIRKLLSEFSEATVNDMRKVTSINIAPRMIDSQAMIYADGPMRTVTTQGKALEGEQAEAMLKLYELPKVNDKLLKAHRYLKFQKQCFLQVVPLRGMLDVRVFQPHQIDVLPDINDPETAFAFIISSFDKSAVLTGGDGRDQKIADRNDSEKKKRESMRFVVWSKDLNFIMNGNGEIIGNPDEIKNPIGRLPFVEIVGQKENEFWVRDGASLIDAAIDFGLMFSDTANVNRLQAYAQSIISAYVKPEEMRVGPREALFLQLDANKTVQPSFEFASPNHDLEGSLKLIDAFVNYLLTSEGLDPKTVNARGENKTYSSGFDRLLGMLQQFEISKEDLSIFETAEAELFEIFKAWHLAYKAKNNAPLLPEYKNINLPLDAKLSVQFHRPELIQTKGEIETSATMLIEKGLRSKVMALQELDGITEDEAIEKLKKIKEHGEMFKTEVEAEFEVIENETEPTNEIAETPSAAESATKNADSTLKDVSLNGAQVTAMVEVVQAVTMGLMPRESAVNIIEVAFNLDRTTAEKVLGSAGKGFKPSVPEQKTTSVKAAE